ncbi:MAG: 5-oxoprolinase subunit PxpB [Akkermansiaceae bacterium]|jgi:KipI family sensor histidine kinase inhibitor|nr:5-oxoprolinase subunit PxpB [Akkermansiaceae bacterium]MDP4646612.1 5-oxoprolinase subunit PxpB [Akkermansiaceae bacterium]MDP4720189.1 5-oxoprolinase subunit PxpB [Akkermansiaceae bacterium]MDP4779821.1 5-oxoprolinase subunit PxpB [Akkermansiaceae bacterium]MDP4846392.1 5-oxoprolinase subunit PxpB [Akkermansiaceae bacterium]
MGLHALGDSGWLFKASGWSSEGKLQLILRLRRILELNPFPEIVDIVSSFDTIAVQFNPADGQKVIEHLTSLHLDDASDQQTLGGQTITIPVVYGGDHNSDLQSLADTKNLTISELIALHRDTEFTVAAIGFSPGFPYLQGLPPELHQPRHASPRKVPAGSVAIAGDQAGIYPFASQGGWHVIGHTDQTLFDPNRENPSLLQPGDKVRFEEVQTLQEPRPAPPEPEPLLDGITVIEPGALTSVQDHGRWGRQHFGVSPGGAADPVLASIANRLVGNPDEAAVIECTMTGAVLQFDTDVRVAWVGWADESSGKPHEFKAGTQLDLRSRMCHLRGYIAVAGGIDVPKILGSRATDLRAVLGGHQGRTLQAGDTLPIGKESSAAVSEKWHVSWPHPDGKVIEIRYLPGMQTNWFTEESHRLFSGSYYEITPTSDRTGTRLNGYKLKLNEPREMVSQPVIFGSIQVPPNGQPIVLMSERQTIGGYPQIGHVISADIPKLARAWPGTQVHFREVDLEEARHAWDELQRDLGILNVGLMMKLQEP